MSEIAVELTGITGEAVRFEEVVSDAVERLAGHDPLSLREALKG